VGFEARTSLSYFDFVRSILRVFRGDDRQISVVRLTRASLVPVSDERKIGVQPRSRYEDVVVLLFRLSEMIGEVSRGKVDQLG